VENGSQVLSPGPIYTLPKWQLYKNFSETMCWQGTVRTKVRSREEKQCESRALRDPFLPHGPAQQVLFPHSHLIHTPLLPLISEHGLASAAIG
jgi:hypothetical protein